MVTVRIDGWMAVVRSFEQVKQSYRLLLDHADAAGIPRGVIAKAAKHSPDWVNKLASAKEGGSLATMDLVSEVFSAMLGLPIAPHELLQPDLIHIKLASVRQIQTQESVNLRTPSVTGSDRPSTYTPATNVPSDARGVDVGSLAAAVSALEQRFATLEEQLADNVAIIFAAYDTLRVRTESMRSTRQPHHVPAHADSASARTGGRTSHAGKHAGKGRG
jgi:hypothetical protein